MEISSQATSRAIAWWFSISLEELRKMDSKYSLSKEKFGDKQIFRVWESEGWPDPINKDASESKPEPSDSEVLIQMEAHRSLLLKKLAALNVLIPFWQKKVGLTTSVGLKRHTTQQLIDLMLKFMIGKENVTIRQLNNHLCATSNLEPSLKTSTKIRNLVTKLVMDSQITMIKKNRKTRFYNLPTNKP